MKKYYLTEVALAQLLIRQLELRFETVMRAKEMLPVEGGCAFAISQFDAQISVLLGAIEDARALVDMVSEEDTEN